jgi:hypothetical protein
MTSFQELNENLNEFNLIKECIKYSGNKNHLYDEYERLLRKYKCDLDDEYLYFNENLSIEFIKEFKNKLSWEIISDNLREFNFNKIEFIREFQDKLRWYDISLKLKEFDLNKIDFIKEFQDKIYWDIISDNLGKWNLNTIEFLREFKDKLDSDDITRCLKYTKLNNINNLEFIREFKDILQWQDVTEWFKYFELDNIDLDYIDFIKEFQDYLFIDEIIINKKDYNKYKNILNSKNKIYFELKYDN